LSDGYTLGVIGIALAVAPSLHLTDFWLGFLGAGSLIGLCFGALLTGPLVDRYGRRLAFSHNMTAVALVSLAQLLVSSPIELFCLRFMLGLLLGCDYVVCKALLIESLPENRRAGTLASMGIAWAVGYALAYFVGYLFREVPDAWRYILATGALPALLAIPLRAGTPESPMWLAARQASSAPLRLGDGTRLSTLLSGHGQRVVFASIMYSCLVIPYFAVGTFIPQVMSALNVKGSLSAGVLYTACLALGAIVGTVAVPYVSRRVFAIGAYLLTALALVGTLLWQDALVLVAAFTVFASALSAAQTLIFVYLPELFDTAIRAAGIGTAMAIGRASAASSTFLLPWTVRHFGVRAALLACISVLVVGALSTYVLGPELPRERAQLAK
jgi:putative MFS transporter